MTRLTTSLILVMLCAVSALGATGDLTYMKQPSPSRFTSMVYVNRFTHGGADKAIGLVSKHSVVGVAPKASGGIHVAIDASKPGATRFDVVRLDFSGTGNFKDAPTATIKMKPPQNGATRGVIGPAVINAIRDGRSIPVSVRGNYWKQKTHRGLLIIMASAMEGTCRFGVKTYPVRVFDGNGNLRFADALKPPFRPQSRMPFDKIMVDITRSKFTRGAVTAFVGQPIFIDGRWYGFDISGMKITARELKIAGGRVKVDAPRWNCTLVGKKYYLSLNGGTGAVEVPADEYRIAQYTVFTGNDPRKRSATISGYGSYPSGKTVTVGPARSVQIPIGAPITATVVATQRGGKVRMNLQMTGALGGGVRSITTNEGRRPKAPEIDVIDKAGKIVYTAKLAYG